MRNRKNRSPRANLGRAAVLLALAACLLLLNGCEKQVKIKMFEFQESSRELNNPNRGFYYIRGFWITDEKEDYEKLVAEKFAGDTDTALTLVQINLQNYRDSAITDKGLANIESLLSALEAVDKQLILRFLYDWDGRNMEKEPQGLNIVLTHVKQLKPLLHRHSRQFFTLQGLLIGNWGEMNGTKFQSADQLRQLAAALLEATDDATFLSVRTPAQWRIVTAASDGQAAQEPETKAAARFGLFNDGILGNESDYGTYGAEGAGEQRMYDSSWGRQEELDFQENICRKTPNGGEVINDNQLNDLANARDAFSAMHITYLNRDYDQKVLEKWRKKTITQDGCFDGMDGLAYMERHLGYRLLITDARLRHVFRKNALSVDVTLKNVGFAPLYREAKAELILYSEEKDQALTYEMPGDPRQLPGGNRSEETLTLHQRIDLDGLSRTEYKVYVSLTDQWTGKQIFLANQQDAGQYGYEIGAVKVK